MTALREEAPRPKRRRSRKYSAEPLAVIPENHESLGPAMQALTPKARRFVLELASGPDGYGSLVRAARAAGYGTASSTENAMKVLAHQALHNPKVQEALREVGGKLIRTEAFLGIHVLVAIARDPKHKDRLRAAVELMNRGGFAVETHHTITVEHVDHDAEAVGQLRMLRGEGISREQLEIYFGKNGLTRFERLLALEDARSMDAAKVINADAA
jgi:uncharacterized protein with GYD domain